MKFQKLRILITRIRVAPPFACVDVAGEFCLREVQWKLILGFGSSIPETPGVMRDRIEHSQLICLRAYRPPKPRNLIFGMKPDFRNEASET